MPGKMEPRFKPKGALGTCALTQGSDSPPSSLTTALGAGVSTHFAGEDTKAQVCAALPVARLDWGGGLHIPSHCPLPHFRMKVAQAMAWPHLALSETQTSSVMWGL
jgi:hypothetical protein